MKQISVIEARVWLEGGRPPVTLLDVREDWEYKIAHLPGSILISMGQISSRSGELPRDQAIIVMCHHGRRSETVAIQLEQIGFNNIYNLNGGINAWSRQVDAAIPTY